MLRSELAVASSATVPRSCAAGGVIATATVLKLAAAVNALPGEGAAAVKSAPERTAAGSAASSASVHSSRVTPPAAPRP